MASVKVSSRIIRGIAEDREPKEDVRSESKVALAAVNGF